MKNLVKLTLACSFILSLTACTGSIQNKDKTCSYDYLLHPSISISKAIGGCGPTNATK
ncbi:DUF4223 family protein [Acetobacter thailandicus]|uniref:DUF4223 family protein n=1 Tax=Acetobacter thailandicus TaxID=1502842 RepID=UPI001BA50EEF|nr:DUF4223 family protein [Acetobacter thailandicus]MBS0981522.1 YhfL family protein [Acetobacter thailandicus]